KTKRGIGMNAEFPAEEEMQKVWSVLKQKDRDRIEQETQALSSLNGKTMAEISPAFVQLSGRGRQFWKLDVPLLYKATRENLTSIPLFFRSTPGAENDAGEALAYIFFCVARKAHPNDSRVQIVNKAFGKMDASAGWVSVLERNMEV